MIIKDQGYILRAIKYGEKSLIVTILSQTKGKITGFVSDGLNKKNRGFYEVGNKVFFESSLRLEENMRRIFRVELIQANAVMMLSDFKRLNLMTSAVPMMIKILNENEEVDLLYDYAGKFFSSQNLQEMLTYYAFFEFYALEYLGLGLSLDCCAVTGQTKGLSYVSPKTGKAVTKEVGAPYHDLLFEYPQFVVDKNHTPSYVEIFNVLRMTEFFLKTNFFKFHNIAIPESRSYINTLFEDILNQEKLSA